MEFRSLKIEAPLFGDNKGKLVAELEIRGKKSKMTLILPDEVGEKILILAKSAIAAGAEKASSDFIAEITTLIPDQLRIS